MKRLIAGLILGVAIGFVVGHFTAGEASGAGCGADPEWAMLYPPPPSWWNPVARWCTMDRPFAVEVIDRTTSPYWHQAIVNSAALWTASGVASVSVTRETAPCEPADGITIVVCNYFQSDPTLDNATVGYETQEFCAALNWDVRFMCRPVVHLNDYWGQRYLDDGYPQSYLDGFYANGAVGHEVGHGLGLWHPATPWPEGYCGTMGGGWCGPAGDYSMLATLYVLTSAPTPTLTQTATPTSAPTPSLTATPTPTPFQCWPPRAKRCR